MQFKSTGENVVCALSWRFPAILDAIAKGGEIVKQRETRFDAIPPSGKLTAFFVTPQAAHEHLTGQQSGAEAARLQMLRRMGLDAETGSSAADARERMIQRREYKRKK